MCRCRGRLVSSRSVTEPRAVATGLSLISFSFYERPVATARGSVTRYFPPVISLALNFGGGGAGEFVNETYCIRKSASRPSNACASC